jgi:hypothetical protein
MQSVPISSDGRDPTTEIDTDDVSSVATPPIGYQTPPTIMHLSRKRLGSILLRPIRVGLTVQIRQKSTLNGSGSFKPHSATMLKSSTMQTAPSRTSILPPQLLARSRTLSSLKCIQNTMETVQLLELLGFPTSSSIGS